jgi:hypothetical protein
MAQRLAGLNDAPGRERKPSSPPEAARIVAEKAVTPPARSGATKLPDDAGISQASVKRRWAANVNKVLSCASSSCPTSLLRRRPEASSLGQKFWDVIGLDRDPPENALVLRCDERSQCQPFDRTKAPLFHPHCVATTVTLSVVFASANTPGPAGLIIRLFPEIANTP